MPPFVTQLVRFRVRNYRCFENLTFDLRVRHDYDWAKDCLTEEGDLIKTPLVMGPISGGKTSLINAMSDVLLYSMPEPLRSERLCRFFASETDEDAARFEWTFTNGISYAIYSYGRREDGMITDEEMIITDTPNDPEKDLRSRQTTGPTLVPDFPLCGRVKMFFEDMALLAEDDEGPLFLQHARCVRNPFQALNNAGLMQGFAGMIRSLGIHDRHLMQSAERLSGDRFDEDFAAASDGLRRIAFLYLAASAENAGLTLIDDFDLHLPQNAAIGILGLFRSKTDAQTVLTARTASLLDTVITRPDSVFRITHESIKPLPSLTLRQLRRSNNIPKLWRAGEFSDQ